MCSLRSSLAHWDQAIEWCEKSITGNPQLWYPYAYLAASYAWAGRDKEAKDTAAQLQSVDPGFTLQTLPGGFSSDIRPPRRSFSASSKACARRACRRANRRRIEPAPCRSGGEGYFARNGYGANCGRFRADPVGAFPVVAGT
jgi:hypothetical protein